MTHGSLFSGIGGFDLAAQWMNWENVFHCEINPFGLRVLSYYWPKAISYTDIKTTDFTPHAQKIDVLSGGFPCQPYSLAGKRKGKEDDRHLWPAMLSAIKVIQPRWIVGENVHGIINWSRGMVFNEVQTDLETEGYQVFPYVLPACGINAPHRRERTWFIAYANGLSKEQRKQEIGGVWREFGDNGQKEIITNPHNDGQHVSNCQDEIHANQGRKHAFDDSSQANSRLVTHPSRAGLARDVQGKQCINERKDEKHAGRSNYGTPSAAQQWDSFPTQSPICAGNDGLSRELDGITFSKWRNESIKGAGNAIVPQLAYKLFKTIEAYEQKEGNNH